MMLRDLVAGQISLVDHQTPFLMRASPIASIWRLTSGLFLPIRKPIACNADGVARARCSLDSGMSVMFPGESGC